MYINYVHILITLPLRTRKKKRQVSKQVTTRDFFGLHRGRGHRYVILTQPPQQSAACACGRQDSEARGSIPRRACCPGRRQCRYFLFSLENSTLSISHIWTVFYMCLFHWLVILVYFLFSNYSVINDLSNTHWCYFYSIGVKQSNVLSGTHNCILR